jgi:hypothetical protein
LRHSRLYESLAALVISVPVMTALGIMQTSFWYFACGTLFGLVVSDFAFHVIPFEKDTFIGYLIFISLVVALSVFGNSMFNSLANWAYAQIMTSPSSSCRLPFATSVGPNYDSYPRCDWTGYCSVVSFLVCLLALWDARTQNSNIRKATAV